MPFQSFDRYYDDYYYKAGYAHHASYTTRDSSRSTRFVINEGRLVVDDRCHYGGKSNTVIYNAPWASMRMESRCDGERCERYCCYERRCDRDCIRCVRVIRERPRHCDVFPVRRRRLLECR
ncbi:hypothetical protein SAMD00023353_7900300 [Rosellinia necatrix]|uniref:Uncharacterized protein n=1 Tax=Rosellinia necatrix TaxID=77044 RepID=A0A1W2TUW9_ROSNE|nr:hypothetical protein SAMD00023353_7900300 [Rosellinia necatrix]